MSGRPGITEKRLSTHRFQQLPESNTADSMGNPNDVTIDIPLSNVSSRGQTGARKTSINTPTPGSPTEYPAPVDTPNANAGNITEKTGLVPGSGNNPTPRRGRRVDTATGRSLEEPEDGTLTRMGKIYQKVLNFSIVTRYLLYITPLAVLLAVPIIVGATATPDATIGGVRLTWFFCWFEVVWFSIWVSKLAARALPFVFQFVCGIVSSGTRKYALVLRNLEMPIATVFWSVISLVTFLPIMTLNPHKKSQGDTSAKSWEKSVKDILFALFVCSLIFLGEKTIVQLISISYHRKQFDQRIRESKRHIHLIGLLYDASRSMFPMYCREFRDDDSIISDSILGPAGGKGVKHSRSNSSAPLRLIRDVGRNVGRFGDKVTAAFGDVAHEITGKEVFNPTSARSIVTQALERKKSSEALARRIWMSFVIEGREALYLEDIAEVLGAGKDSEAEECFLALDRDGNGDISLDEMILAIGEIGRTRKSLNHSVHDVDQAIRVLDNLLMTVAFIVGILVFVSFVTSGFGTVIAAGATSLLSLSFVFSTTAQEVLGSCIFLFVKHPFDVGDRVEISDKPYIVERISLLFTVLRSVTDHRITQVPNVVLNTLWIDNFTRSNAMHETLTVPVSFDTTFSDIQLLRDAMERFVRDKDNCRDFQPDLNVDVTGVGDMDKLELSVGVFHKSNWSNDAVRAARRSKFMCALIATVRKIPIRAPGAAPDDADSDTIDADKKDDQDDKSRSGFVSEGTRGLSTLDTAGPNGTSLSTGFDFGQSSGSLHRRGAGVRRSMSTRSEGTYPELQHEHSAIGDSGTEQHDGDNYQTPAASPNQNQDLTVPYTSLTHAPSTGRRREGARSPYPNANATGGVPILSHPAPPRRASTYQPPGQPSTRPPPPPEHYPYAGHYYEAQGGVYDPPQPFELPSVVEPGAPAPESLPGYEYEASGRPESMHQSDSQSRLMPEPQHPESLMPRRQPPQ